MKNTVSTGCFIWNVRWDNQSGGTRGGYSWVFGCLTSVPPSSSSLPVSLWGCVCMLSCFSCVWLFATPQTVAHQALLSMGFSRQEYQSGLPCAPPGDLPDPRAEPMSLKFPSLAGRLFTTSATWEAHIWGHPTPIAIYSSPRIYRTHPNLRGLSYSSMSFLPFHTVHRVTQARILEWFAIPSSSGGPNEDLIFSELFTMIHPSWVAPHSMAHSFTELHKPLCHDKPVIQHATGEEQRAINNSSSKNEAAGLKYRWCSVVDVSGGESTVWFCKEQYCIWTWNVSSMNQGKLDVVRQKMARLNIDILGISELKWTGMVKFNSDDHYTYYCGQEPLRRNGIALIVNKRVWNAILGCSLKNNRIISVLSQGKPFNITVIQVYAPTTDAEEAEVDWFYVNLQHLVDLTHTHTHTYKMFFSS